MADQPFPREQSLPVQFLKTGLLAGLEGALNPDVRREAQQFITLYRQMDEAHQERVLMQERGGRVLKQAIIQIYEDFRRQRARNPNSAILGVRADANPLRDTTASDV